MRSRWAFSALSALKELQKHIIQAQNNIVSPFARKLKMTNIVLECLQSAKSWLISESAISVKLATKILMGGV